MESESKFEQATREVSLININETMDSSNGKIYFRIPQYQRGYAWGTKQFDDLWQDIILINNSNNKKNHYTGMLTLQTGNDGDYSYEDLDKKNDDKLLYVTDGQQRLTTIFILIACVIQYAQKHNWHEFDCQTKQNRLFYEYYKPFLTYSKKRLGNDREVLESIFFNNTLECDETTYYGQNLLNARNFFNKKIENECRNDIDKLNNLYNTITNNLVFNILVIGSSNEKQDNDSNQDFNINIIFETMNNRGKQLSVLEKLKNRLIYLINYIGDKNTSSFISEVEKAWSSVYENLGKYKQQLNDDDDFLRSHWMIYFGLVKDRGNDFEKVLLTEKFNQSNLSNLCIKSNNTDNQDSNKTSILDYCDKLKEYSRYWSKIKYIEYDKDIKINIADDLKSYFQKISHIGVNRYVTTYLAVLMMLICKCENSDELKENFLNHLKLLERFFFIRKYIGKLKNDFSFFATSAKDIYNLIKDKNIDQEVLIKQLKSLEKELKDNDKYGINTLKEDDKTKFLSTVNELFEKENGFYSWPGIYYFLYEYNMDLAKQNERNDKSKLPWTSYNHKSKNKFTIEHIYPQNPSKDGSWETAFKGYDEKERKDLKNALGNLLPLEKAINVKFQNYGFSVKKEGIDNNKECPNYISGSMSEIDVSKKTYWTAEEISERTKKLLVFLNRNWNLDYKADELKKLEHIPNHKVKVDKATLDKQYQQEKEARKEYGEANNYKDNLKELTNDDLINYSSKRINPKFEKDFCKNFWNKTFEKLKIEDTSIYEKASTKIDDNCWQLAMEIEPFSIWFKLLNKNVVCIFVYANNTAFEKLKQYQSEIDKNFENDAINWNASKANNKSKKVIISKQFKEMKDGNCDSAQTWLTKSLYYIAKFISQNLIK